MRRPALVRTSGERRSDQHATAMSAVAGFGQRVDERKKGFLEGAPIGPSGWEELVALAVALPAGDEIDLRPLE